ncbi:MAG: macro domain-containing protein [Coriobacteriia bacterium]|nr:macro domain-containing protein [Coriobacteriia bacterium]
MIHITRGNLLEADAEALVNTVNCVGFMGKGIALQFKQAFPENFREYEKVCRARQMCPGRMLVVKTGCMGNPKFVINFPTKRHWRGKARVEDIRKGLSSLVQEVVRLGVRSIAVPPLGCGLGGLDWSEVRPMIEDALAAIPDVRVLLYEPRGAPEAGTMPVRTEHVAMTPARALLVKLMQQYLEMAYRLTLLEIQKLAYFLQESGEGLRLRYEKGHYGPYAPKLNKVLERIEGHLTRGYGDSQQPDVEIKLLPEAVERADAFLTGNDQSKARLERVARLIEGFETPYGMELLASVHWVWEHETPGAEDETGAIGAIHGWNARKQAMFNPEHIRIAWRRLTEQGWLASSPCRLAP